MSSGKFRHVVWKKLAEISVVFIGSVIGVISTCHPEDEDSKHI
jgi:hypothetical protein